MPDTDKVIKDLTRCQRCECDNCTLEDKSGYPWDCTARENLIDYAIAKLKELEARVLTIEKMEDALDTVVWLDMPGSENLADGYSLIMAYSHKNGFVLMDSPFGDNPSQDRYEYSEYGKTWRCWSSRPTEKQRQAVPWK